MTFFVHTYPVTVLLSLPGGESQKFCRPTRISTLSFIVTLLRESLSHTWKAKNKTETSIFGKISQK